jgi:hypothetical protein
MVGRVTAPMVHSPSAGSEVAGKHRRHRIVAHVVVVVEILVVVVEILIAERDPEHPLCDQRHTSCSIRARHRTS